MKAILLVNKEESCTSCMLGIYNKKWFCLATNKDIDITDRYNIPTWCPLKPMPEKGTMDNVEPCAYNEGFIDGINHCIELITGETK